MRRPQFMRPISSPPSRASINWMQIETENWAHSMAVFIETLAVFIETADCHSTSEAHALPDFRSNLCTTFIRIVTVSLTFLTSLFDL